MDGRPGCLWAWNVSAAAAANWLLPSRCVCHCSGNQADDSQLQILKSQLDSCGPEALHGFPQPTCPEPVGQLGDGLGATLASSSSLASSSAASCGLVRPPHRRAHPHPTDPDFDGIFT